MKTTQTCSLLPVDQLLSELNVDPQTGLSASEVTKRIEANGFNELQKKRRSHVVVEFLKNFKNPLILILLVIVAISFGLGDAVNGSIVLLMLLMSVTLNFYQEHKANNAAEKLGEKVALFSTVLRDGKQIDVKGNQLCIGDVLLLNAGDLIQADAVLIETKDFFVNQSALTGEAFPVEKNECPPKVKDGEIGNQTNVIFSGTSVVTGTAKAIVVAIGTDTEFGKIATELNKAEQENNFTKGIKEFSFFILRIVVVFVLFIFLVNSLIKHDFVQSLSFAIAVAVGLTPEFLPMIMTVTMSKGAVLMAKKGVIVKKLTAIPSFGSMNILCTDKTGTITEDKITLVKCIDTDGADSQQVLELAYVNSCMQTGITNPLDEAIQRFQKINIHEYKKIDEIPFDFNRRRMSVVVQHGDERLMITKGAPESLLEESKYVFLNGRKHVCDEKTTAGFVAQYQKLSSEGYRVLALATRSIEDTKTTYDKGDEKDLTLIGFTAFLDPVKHNAREAITALEKIGIEVKVVTGDNELVTKRACEEAGIEVKGMLLGSQIKDLTDQALAARALQTTIFARFSPIEKERIIRVLRMSGNVVGYMGDGINDAPSIKAADVGISVNNAVDVAKESADFILTHKSLLELKDGVIEGRIIFGNTMKYIMMGLSSSFGNMFSVLGAVLFLPFLPMLPVQILLNNFLYDLSQVTIPSDNVDAEYLQTPKHWNITFIRKFMMVFGPISSVFDFLTFYLMYSLFSHNAMAFQTGWFLESLATQTLVIHVIRTRKLPFFQSRASTGLTISTFLVVLIGWLIPFTPARILFSFVQLPLSTMFLLAWVVVVYLVFVEIGKRIFYRNFNTTL